MLACTATRLYSRRLPVTRRGSEHAWRAARRGRDGIGDGLWVWVGGHPSSPVIKFKRVTVTQALLLQGCPRLNFVFYYGLRWWAPPPYLSYPILSHPGPGRPPGHACSLHAGAVEVRGGRFAEMGGSMRKIAALAGRNIKTYCGHYTRYTTTRPPLACPKRPN